MHYIFQAASEPLVQEFKRMFGPQLQLEESSCSSDLSLEVMSLL